MAQLLVELGAHGVKKGLRKEEKMINYLNSKIRAFLNIEYDEKIPDNQTVAEST